MRATGDDNEPIEGWLAELGLEPQASAEREGVRSWDLVLDGRQRRGVRVTLIHQPGLALVAWVHYAPPLSDGLRKAYHRLLHWNDELPFAKFALSEDERPVLTAEVPAAMLDRDALGLTLARVLAICDLLYPETLPWLQPRDRRRAPVATESDPAGGRLLERYATQLEELTGRQDADAG